MRFLFKALLAATALVPVAAAANAQEASPERDRGRRMERSPDDNAPAPDRPRGDWSARRGPDQARPDGSGEFRPSQPGPRQWTGQDGRGRNDRTQGDRARPGDIDPPPPRLEAGNDPRAQGGWNDRRNDPRSDSRVLAQRGDGRIVDQRGDGRVIDQRGDGRIGDQRGDSRILDQQRDGRRFDGNRSDRRGWDDRRFDGRDPRNQPRFDQQRGNRGYVDRGNWNGNDRGGWQGNGQGNWNRTWRNDQRYDWNRYRTVNRNAYHLPRYYAPSGWSYGYRRFSLGATLGANLWDQRYWIGDPYAYRLPEAYGPFRWVRYYDDALLVDLRSGRVVDTVYGIFW